MRTPRRADDGRRVREHDHRRASSGAAGPAAATSRASRSGREDDRKLVRFNAKPAVGARRRASSRRRTPLDVADAVLAEVVELLRRELPRRRAASTSPSTRRPSSARSIADVTRTIFEAVAAGRARDLPVPAQLPRDPDPGGRDPGLDHRHLRRALLPRLLDQHAHADGAHARDRPRRRRRDRRAREHHALGRGAARRRCEAARRGMDEISFAVVAATISVGRGVPAARVPHRQDGPPLPRVRRHGRGVGRHLGLRRAHARRPMLCARVLRPQRRRARREGAASRAASTLSPRLRRRLAAALAAPRHSVLAVGRAWVALGRCAPAGGAARVHPDGRPRHDPRLHARRPRAARSTYTDRYQRQVEDIVLSDCPRSSKRLLGRRARHRRRPAS